ncbi:MAG TPA: hypothetical protein DCK98_18495 [Chloroflexi bacterium]|nr:hypothetical protein [Chloroflexota bacterium]HAL27496.1 hypothetical protein [Chloroflexota bacterium]
MAAEAGTMSVLRVVFVALSVVLALVATVLGWLSRDTPTPAGQSLGTKALDIGVPIAALTFVAVAELIRRRHPRHLVGWMFLLLGLSAEILFASEAYGLFGTITAPGALPAAGTVMWLATWTWALPVIVLAIALLVFPDGRPLSPRWWIVAWIAIVSGVLQSVADAYGTPLVLTDIPMDTPLGTPFPLDALNVVSTIGTLGSVAATLAAGTSLIIRFRRAAGIERQQLKWVAYGGAIATVGFVLGSVGYVVPEIGPLGNAVASFAVLLIPITAGLAILRYRLYDVDVVIERTLVYGALSATLAATYWLLVLFLQSALRPITAGSELAVAASTLATLALVQPLRMRIQRSVDRRFYRGRYDAVRALDRFTTELASEVALDAVRADLLEAVRETVQPAHASVWLRERRI